MIQLNENLKFVLCGIFAALTVGSIVRLLAVRNTDADTRKKRLGSLFVWWILAVVVSVATVTGTPGVSMVLAVAGILGLREYLKLLDTQQLGRPAVVVAYASVALQYFLVIMNYRPACQLALPVAGLLLCSAARLATGKTPGYIRLTSGLYWGILLLVYNLSHAALMTSPVAAGSPPVGLMGPFLFVVIITEADDIAQALTGRRFGKHKITPTISPHKTWEGFAGGVVTSVLLSLGLSGWLTDIPAVSTARGFLAATAAGLLIAGAGFLGDINMSAVKRDVGVKDGSNLLPGMGGIIDRVDSLTFTAPAFYYFLLLSRKIFA